VSDFHVEHRSGHLVLATWSGFLRKEGAERFRSSIGEAIVRAQPTVICADWRAAETVSQEVSEILLSILKGAHPLLARSAILLHPVQGTFTLQAERLVREAGFPHRRTFRVPHDAIAWLGEVLPPAELEAARRFLRRESGSGA
jgi:hypothetical protein